MHKCNILYNIIFTSFQNNDMIVFGNVSTYYINSNNSQKSIQTKSSIIQNYVFDFINYVFFILLNLWVYHLDQTTRLNSIYQDIQKVGSHKGTGYALTL